jgi:hypothetical protein
LRRATDTFWASEFSTIPTDGGMGILGKEGFWARDVR